jgi:integrase/recombinase XerD
MAVVMNKKELQKAYESGLITDEKYKEELFKNATTNINKPKKRKKLPEAINDDEFRLLIQATKKDNLKIAFLLGYAAGMRLSEIIGGIRSDGSEMLPLTKEKVDFENKQIKIVDAKGGKDRVVPLPKGFKESFLKYLPLTKQFKTIAGGRRALQRGFKLSAKRAGLLIRKPDLHFHSLRHGFGSRLAGQKVPIHHIRTLMGHSNISTTNVYLESNPQEALKSYEDLF